MPKGWIPEDNILLDGKEKTLNKINKMLKSGREISIIGENSRGFVVHFINEDKLVHEMIDAAKERVARRMGYDRLKLCPDRLWEAAMDATKRTKAQINLYEELAEELVKNLLELPRK